MTTPPSEPVDRRDYTITVEAFDMADEHYDAIFVRVADVAHALGEVVCVGGMPNPNAKAGES